MKLLELQLLAFGPFTGARLDFSSPLPGLHVVYGANEAGKSTALRAVRGFLYGIEPRTRDAHLHRMPDLRVGARVSDEAGNVLELVRRKGNQRTLLDAAGKPVDEAVLARLLHGISEPLFSTAFGLDHDGLRRGGEALLAGGGDLGESLLEAGLGSGALHQALRSLRAEAEALFTPQAQVKPINQAIKAF